MDQLILQVGERFGRQVELTRSHGDTLTVGRGYGSDLVIADPYVDPQQLAFYRSPEGWRLRVVQDTNPVLVNGRTVGGDAVEVRSGDRITVGRTQLRVYDSRHEVEPTHKLLLSSWFGRGRSHPLFALSMVVFACAVEMFDQYQGLSTELEWNDLFTASLSLVLIILFWASVWALAGRLLRHQPNFTAQLGFTALIIGIMSLLTPLWGYVQYALNSVLLGDITLWLILLVFLAVLFRVNLSFATNLKHYTAAGVIAAAALLLTTYAFLEFGEDDFSTDPEYPTVLKPPFAHLSGSRDRQTFSDAFDGVFDEVDELARQE